MSIHESASPSSAQSTTADPAREGRDAPPAGKAGPARRRTMVATGAGNALEWYDWNIYAVFAPFFAGQFFHRASPVSALLSAFAVFAVGFLMRPIGGYVFGRIADRRGRRVSMLASVGLAAAGSLLIGVAPTYGSVGVAASLVLVLARLLQGLAHGGEIAAGHTYIAEIAPRDRRGRWSSIIYISGMAANTLGILLGAAMTTLLDGEAMSAWGWRVPFLIGGVLGLLALYVRRTLPETSAFERERGHGGGNVWHNLWQNRGSALRVVGLTVGGTIFFYTWAVAAPAYAIGVQGMDESQALWAGVVATVIMILALPFAGALSDRFGWRPNFLVFSIGAAALTFPLNRLIKGEFWQLALSMSIALIFMALAVAILPALFAELFPTNVRAAGIGLPYSLAVALTGGTAPYLQTWLSAGDQGDLFLGYTVVLLLIGAGATLAIPETKGKSLE